MQRSQFSSLAYFSSNLTCNIVCELLKKPHDEKKRYFIQILLLVKLCPFKVTKYLASDEIITNETKDRRKLRSEKSFDRRKFWPTNITFKTNVTCLCIFCFRAFQMFLAALIKRKILNIGLWKVKSSRFSYTNYDQKSKKKFWLNSVIVILFSKYTSSIKSDEILDKWQKL